MLISKMLPKIAPGNSPSPNINLQNSLQATAIAYTLIQQLNFSDFEATFFLYNNISGA